MNKIIINIKYSIFFVIVLINLYPNPKFLRVENEIHELDRSYTLKKILQVLFFHIAVKLFIKIYVFIKLID